MHKRNISAAIPLLLILWLCVSTAGAADKELSLFHGTGVSTLNVITGDTITLNVVIDDASVVAGASFTVTYDTTNLTLDSVESTFFGTFVSQSIPTPSDQGYVEVDGQQFFSPIVDNVVSGLTQSSVATGSMLAAARVDNGSGTNVAIFSLSFIANGAGTFPVTIVQSKLNNADAGYNPDGEFIPFFVGIVETDSYTTHDVPTINGATLVVGDFVDTDGDGIDDNWEIANLPDGYTGDPLDAFSRNGDYDGDGYSDYDEYLNRYILDPLGKPFNPTVVNAPGGIGYENPDARMNSAILNLLLSP